ncbi:hypothetical protein GCM10010284_24270 [Streptomyces rubiginosohelvolus]|uniref:Uncharacterized protein n=1 Tax=Streptomyces rubiginosohelvolus TaxID=67362 RepID=A0ABQ3CAG3_9ACTN|nr:hypothetical protein GCM10010284_24270 [Streptomyces rubiginosohelvolus]GGZ73875.1 hypothetical protein GCM10010328_56080 [Streptomyces pluricolorescens]
MVQNPSVRPSRSPRERPTGAPQSEREQNRLRSGTSARSITAVRGSGRGTSGTSTRPTPSRPRAEAADVEPEERTETEREVDAPDSERDSRPETDRREVDERDEDRAEARELERCEELSRLLARPPPAIPVGGEETIPVGETTGARPQVSQYSSPPPMSS